MKKLLIAITLLSAQFALADMEVASQEAGILVKPKAEMNEGERIVGKGSKTPVIDTRTIPAKIGIKFGVRYQLSGKAEKNNLVKLIYLTPGVVDGKGARHDKYEVTQDLSQNASSHVIAFEFTENNELVTGTWRLMVFEDDKALIDESFEVVAP